VLEDFQQLLERLFVRKPVVGIYEVDKLTAVSLQESVAYLVERCPFSELDIDIHINGLGF